MLWDLREKATKGVKCQRVGVEEGEAMCQVQELLT